jgi:alkanesulfonate monooxygenase SsuD/methylene tetrahydromethanopterin reductase-like flavin-dependent oxidoreductase (luciferase family)
VSRPVLALAPWATDPSGSTAVLEPLVRQCERAEELGFHSVWIPESHFAGRGATPAPLLLLAAIAARTKTLRLGTTSYLLPIRHPLHVAAEVAVLDRLSEGRVILGVGRGFRAATFEAFAIPRQEKRDRFEAALDVMQRAWRGEAVTDESEQPVTLAPLPVQTPHPPIWVAAFGPKALAQAGRLGLPYLASPMEPLDVLAQNYARHREACDDDARWADLAVPVMRTIFVSKQSSVLRRVREALEKQMVAVRQARVLPGRDADEPIGVDEFALTGEPAEVAEGMERYREQLRVTHMIARVHVPEAEAADIDRSIELLAALGQGDGG